MKHSWLVISITALLILGCGQSDPNQIYDTSANPSNFPALALELIQALDQNKLVGLDSITEAFGNLYTEHSELLDHPEWKEIVARMGVCFASQADNYQAAGMGSYTLAAEYYQLGSFARPDDAELHHQAEYFSSWITAGQTSPAALKALIAGQAPTFDGLTGLLRSFLLADTIGRRFYREEVLVGLTGSLAAGHLLAPDSLKNRAVADLALLNLAGLTGSDQRPDPLWTVGPPTIDVLAARLSRTDSITYLFEIYFVPREPIDSLMKVMVRLEGGSAPRDPLELLPGPPAFKWPVDSIAVVAGVFRFAEPITGAEIAVAEIRQDDQIRFLMPRGPGYHYRKLGPDELDLN
jgi:hypothetical protein